MSDVSQLNVRLWNADIETIKRLAKKRHVSQAVIVAEAIRLLASTPRYRRDRACVRLCVTHDDRERFIAWCVDNEVPLFATLPEWENYLLAFDTRGDSADLDATQKDALGVLA